MNEESHIRQEEIDVVQPTDFVDRPVTRLYPGIRWSDVVASMNAETGQRDAA